MIDENVSFHIPRLRDIRDYNERVKSVEAFCSPANELIDTRKGGTLIRVARRTTVPHLQGAMGDLKINRYYQ